MEKYLNKLITTNFDRDVVNTIKIDGGWLTKKWKISFVDSSIMVKVIENKKIEKRNIDIELAAKLLENLNEQGLKCPSIYRINGNLVSYNNKKNPIIVTEYIDNTFLKDYTNITKSEIFSLGREIAKMRNCFKNIKHDGFIDYDRFISEISKNYMERIEKGKFAKNIKYLQDVKKQKKIINSLKKEFFMSLEIGYCHCDLSQDNILFDNDGFKAIVDFELASKSFVLRDIARIFLTFCLDNNGNINTELFKELLNGYNTLDNITTEDIVNGIKILWCLEVGIWIKDVYYLIENPPKVQKFIYEINWITQNWFNLNEIIKI